MKYHNNYNDEQVANNKQVQLMTQDYNQNNEEKEHDLLTLYEEMRKQREYMLSSNSDHSLDQLIESTDNHISILSTMLSKKGGIRTTARAHTPQPNLRPYINNNIYNDSDNYNINNRYTPNQQPNPTGLPNSNNNVPNTDNGSTTPNANNESRLPNTNNNAPSIDNTNTTEPPITNNTSDNTPHSDNNTPTNELSTINNSSTNNTRRGMRTGTRSFPLQSGIATIARAIFGKFRPINTMRIDEHRNRFHNRVVEYSTCKPRNKLITNECNILRLLLLYITLHPYCRHNSTLSTIANERLEILTTLI